MATIRRMTVTAPVCPNCGAPLTIHEGRCAFCHVPLEVAPPAPGPGPAAPPPPPEAATGDPTAPFAMVVEDVFAIAKRGTVVTGRIASGSVRVGDALVVDGAAGSRPVTCNGVEMFRKKLDTAAAGDNVGLLLDGVEKGEVAAGDRLRPA